MEQEVNNRNNCDLLGLGTGVFLKTKHLMLEADRITAGGEKCRQCHVPQKFCPSGGDIAGEGNSQDDVLVRLLTGLA